jgi:hypothetical protein
MPEEVDINDNPLRCRHVLGSFFLVYSPDLLFTREVFPAGGTHADPSKLTSYKALEAQRAAREG